MSIAGVQFGTSSPAEISNSPIVRVSIKTSPCGSYWGVMSTRYVGTCPVCDARYKVRGGKLVHHGFRRPGYGHIVGDCFAVGMEPHESSPHAAEKYREHVQVQLAALESERVAMHSVETLGYTYKVSEGLGRSKSETVLLRNGDKGHYVGSARIPSFEDHKQRIVAVLTQQITWAGATVERMTSLINGWTAQPLVTVEEETSRIKLKTQAERELKRQERLAKKAKKDARKAQRDAKAQSKLDELLARARAILDRADASDVRAVQEAYVLVLGLKVPSSLEDRFFDALDQDGRARAAGLFFAHNGRLIRHEFQVRELIARR